MLILGGGHAGLKAAQIAVGLCLNITIIENYDKRITELSYMLPGVEVVMYDDDLLKEELK